MRTDKLASGMVGFEGVDTIDGVGNRAVLFGDLGIDGFEVLEDDFVFGIGKLGEPADGIFDGFDYLGVCHGSKKLGLTFSVVNNFTTPANSPPITTCAVSTFFGRGCTSGININCVSGKWNIEHTIIIISCCSSTSNTSDL